MLHHSKEAAPKGGLLIVPAAQEPHRSTPHDAFMISACFSSFMAENSAS